MAIANWSLRVSQLFRACAEVLNKIASLHRPLSKQYQQSLLKTQACASLIGHMLLIGIYYDEGHDTAA
jgi:hypothetical protein